MLRPALAAALAAAFLTSAGRAQDVAGPLAPVARLCAALEELGGADPAPAFAQRALLLEPVVRATHDLGALAGALLSAEPGAADASLAAALGRWCAARYAAAVEDAGAPRFAPPALAEEQDGRARVTVALAGGEGAPLVALLGAAQGAWRVRDVLVDGASQAEALRARAPQAADAGALALWLDAQVARAAETATETIARLQDALANAMARGETLGYEGRRALLAPVLEDTHDLPLLARLVGKGFWDAIGPEQRERFARAFRDLTVATYAARFERSRGERFERTGERALRGGVQVQSRLVRPAGAPVAFDYLLRREGGRWRILNITVDGVSDLAVRRAEYESLFRQEGFDGLLARLQEQIRRQEQGGDGE